MTDQPSKIKIFCCYTTSHEEIYLKYFKTTLPACVELQTIHQEGNGDGNFRTDQWMATLRNKMNLVVESIASHPGEILIWSDIDILFFRPIAAELQALLDATGKDILFQREGKFISDINGGFYVLKANRATLCFFQQVCKGLAENPNLDDQAMINRLLSKPGELAWGHLPLSYYARTHGWPPPHDLAIYHANETAGKDSLQQKIAQFRDVLWIRKYGTVARLISSLGKIPKRLRRLIKERR